MRGVHRAGAGSADGDDLESRLLQQPVEHAPGEGTVRAAALKRDGQADGHAGCSIRAPGTRALPDRVLTHFGISFAVFNVGWWNVPINRTTIGRKAYAPVPGESSAIRRSASSVDRCMARSERRPISSGRAELAHHPGQVHAVITAAQDAHQMQRNSSDPVIRHRRHVRLLCGMFNVMGWLTCDSGEPDGGPKRVPPSSGRRRPGAPRRPESRARSHRNRRPRTRSPR